MHSFVCTYESYTEKVATTSWLLINIFSNEECHGIKVSLKALNSTIPEIILIVFEQWNVFKAFLMVSLRKSPVTKSSSVVCIAFFLIFTQGSTYKKELNFYLKQDKIQSLAFPSQFLCFDIIALVVNSSNVINVIDEKR